MGKAPSPVLGAGTSCDSSFPGWGGAGGGGGRRRRRLGREWSRSRSLSSPPRSLSAPALGARRPSGSNVTLSRCCRAGSAAAMVTVWPGRAASWRLAGSGGGSCCFLRGYFSLPPAPSRCSRSPFASFLCLFMRRDLHGIRNETGKGTAMPLPPAFSLLYLCVYYFN